VLHLSGMVRVARRFTKDIVRADWVHRVVLVGSEQPAQVTYFLGTGEPPVGTDGELDMTDLLREWGTVRDD
jgi:hypothetical protein